MADPFEVRMRFTTLLTHLSASATASIKTAHYALKHRDMDEDLHSCILENLERGNNMNNRANIMYFLEHHADINMKEGGHEAYVEMVKRDIRRIVDAVAQSGANVKVVRRVVTGLGEKGVLSPDVLAGIESGLKEKEERLGRLLGDEDGKQAEGGKDAMDTAAEGEGAADTQKATPKPSAQHTRPNGVSKMDKRAIEQRIEEDRERNKRLRESVWAVTGDDDQELEKMWEEGSQLGGDERVIAGEEAEERLQFTRYHRMMLGS
jgi:CTD kinase subunit gamma